MGSTRHRHVIESVLLLDRQVRMRCGVLRPVKKQIPVPGEFFGRSLNLCRRCERFTAPQQHQVMRQPQQPMEVRASEPLLLRA